MTWQEKMNIVIGEVLGEGYEVKIIDDTNFEVYFVESRILKTEVIAPLPNHWRRHISDAINIIIKQQIEIALSKV